MRTRRWPLAALALALVSSARADDWPQWLGPTRDGRWAEAGVLTEVPAAGLKQLWSRPVGGGYSGPAVVGGRVYVTDYQKATGEVANNPAKRVELTGQERVLCLDAKTGEEVWKHAYDCKYSVSYPVGPRTTPTVSGGKVYAVGAMGDLVCLDAATGKPVWAKDFKTDYAAKTPIWGFAGHPLVYENLLICVVGGDGTTAVAFDKDTGKEVWRKLSAPEPGYSSPTLITAGGVEQLLIWHAKSINALNPKTGERYWSVDLEPSYGMAIMVPRQSGDYLFAGGIGGKAVVIELDKTKPAAKEVWRGTKSTGVYPVNSSPIIDDGTIYAVDQPGQLRAVTLATGARKWSSFVPTVGKEQDDDFRGAGSGTAFLVKNANRYYLFAETGHLVVAELTPEKYTEHGRFKLLEPTSEAFGRKVVWSHPAFANKCIYARNDTSIVCYSLAAE